ncbi:MAG: energy transducer TonB [Chitinispirillaceae bacterium]|nr:energy transducer TonB [Chitinispirillaceae bacterium]
MTKVASAFAVLVVLLPATAPTAVSRPDRMEASEGRNRSGADASVVGFSSEPHLVTEGTVDLPLQLLIKKGVDGTVEVDVDIDKRGTVERCVVRKSVDPLLDSLVCASMMRSTFSPAYNGGRAVGSTVAMSFTFDPASVARNSAEAAPEINGVVVEKGTSLPVKSAKINLEVLDSLHDRDIAVSMSRYLRIIGTVPGQSEKNGILSTATDSSGRFAFRLLPACPVRMAIIAPRYAIAHAMLEVVQGVTKKVSCRLEPIEKDTALEIVVYGTPLNKRRIDIEEEQIAAGLTHYLSDILQTKAEIRAIPESKSMMMVRAGSPFDNRYYICGVPFLAPFHFGGHSYADIDGMMISALSEIDLTVDGIAGKQIDASGFRVDAQPSIYRPANRKLLSRPELSVDFNTMGQDFLLSLARKKTDDCLQFGFTRAEKGTLRFFSVWYKMQENQFGTPIGYGNVTLTGAGTLKSLHFDSFSWFAWDKYAGRNNETIPWGMASVTMRSDKKGVPVIRAGGSRQYFASGKRAGDDTYRKFTEQSNGTVAVTFDSLPGSVFDWSLDLQAEYSQWNGFVNGTFQAVFDSSKNLTTGRKEYTYVDTAEKRVVDVGGEEMSLQVHGFAGKTFGRVTAGIDLLCAGLLYGNEPDLIGDAGVSVIWNGHNLRAGLYGGRVTTRPDIRGQPDTLFRRRHLSAYLFALPVYYRFGPQVKIGVQPYLRIKSIEPKLDPLLQVWVPDSSTKLFAAGADLDAELQLFDWLALTGIVNLSRARRLTNDEEAPYEWDVPWTGRGGIHTQFGDEAQMHFYFNGIAAKGLPFYDFIKYGFIRAPNYLRFDLSMQYRSRFIDHRFLTRYDAYFNVFNLTDRYNATDYYWDDSMHIRAIPQGQVMIEMGVRLGFRL